MRFRINTVISFMFGLMTVVILTNLNFILFILKGTFGVLSLYIFSLTIISLITILLFKKNKVGSVGQLFFFFLFIYLINSFLSVLDFNLPFLEYISQFFNYLKSILIFISFYFFFKHLDSINKLNSFIIFVSIVLLASNSTIFFMELYDLNIRLSYSGELILDKWARASGIWGNSNKAASFCLINVIIFMSFSLKSSVSGIKKALLFLSILFLCYCIYLTLSNTILIITSLIIVLYLYFFTMHLTLKTKLKILLISSLSILLLGIIFSNQIFSQYENLTPAKKEKIANVLSFFNIGEKKETSFTNRAEALQIGLKKVRERPFMGNGLGVFRKSLYKEDGIHNFYIQLLGEGGFLSLLAYVLLLLFLIYKVLLKNEFQKSFLISSFFIFLSLYGLTTHGLLLVKGYCVIFALFFVLFESKYFNTRAN